MLAFAIVYLSLGWAITFASIHNEDFRTGIEQRTRFWRAMNLAILFFGWLPALIAGLLIDLRRRRHAVVVKFS